MGFKFNVFTGTLDLTGTSGGGGGGGVWVEETPSGLINSSNQTFTLSHTPDSNSLLLFLNGVYQAPVVDYTLSGSTITFVTAPDSSLSGLPFIAVYTFGGLGGSGGGTWGSITGTLSAQTDLQTVLNGRVPYTGATADVFIGGNNIILGKYLAMFCPAGALSGEITMNQGTYPSSFVKKWALGFDSTSGANLALQLWNGSSLTDRALFSTSSNLSYFPNSVSIGGSTAPNTRSLLVGDSAHTFDGIQIYAHSKYWYIDHRGTTETPNDRLAFYDNSNAQRFAILYGGGIMLPSATLLGTTLGGAIENDGSHLYFTPVDAGTRYQLDQQMPAAAGNNGDVQYNNSGNMTGSDNFTYDGSVLTLFTSQSNNHSLKIALDGDVTNNRNIWIEGNNDMSFISNYSGNTAKLDNTGAWVDASDVSIKDNIVDLKYGTDSLMKLQPRSYTMKRPDDKERIAAITTDSKIATADKSVRIAEIEAQLDAYAAAPQIGFVAQEVKDIIPEVVRGEDGSEGVLYGHLVALCVKVIQEQQKTIQDLQNRVTILEKGAGITPGGGGIEVLP